MDIRKIFRKKEKNEILIDWEPALGMLQEGSVDINEIIEKCSKNMPPYWYNLQKGFNLEKTLKFHSMANLNLNIKKEKEKFDEIHKEPGNDKIWDQGNGISRVNASTCPSFNEIFKNSYILKTPVDFFIEVERNKIKILSSNERVLEIASHPLKEQLWGDFNKNLINIKFEMKAFIKTLNKRTNMVFLDNIFYSDLPFRVMPGILPIDPKYPVAINLNTTMDKRFFERKKYTKLVKAGSPLAMLYMPSGILDLKIKRLGMPYQKYFIADHIKKINKK